MKAVRFCLIREMFNAQTGKLELFPKKTSCQDGHGSALVEIRGDNGIPLVSGQARQVPVMRFYLRIYCILHSGIANTKGKQRDEYNKADPARHAKICGLLNGICLPLFTGRGAWRLS